MRASVPSQCLLFQLDVFSEHLWPEAVREGQTSMLRPLQLTLGVCRTSQWLNSGLLDSGLKLRVPAALS